MKIAVHREWRRARLAELISEFGIKQLSAKTGIAEAYLYQMSAGTGAQKRGVGDSMADQIEEKIGRVGWFNAIRADAGRLISEWEARDGHLFRPPTEDAQADRVPSLDLLFVDKVKGAKLSGGAGAVAWEFEEVDKSHAFRLDWMTRKGLKADRCKVWTVRGDSMEPRYPDGSWVLINMAEREPIHGKNFALVGDDGLRLKQLRRSESGGWAMYSLNPDQSRYPPEPIVADNYAIIGRVRGHGGDDD